MEKRTKLLSNPIDLTLDYHAHILPGCDHGSDGIETSLKQISMAKKAGVRTICATPHFYPHEEGIRSFLIRRQQSFQVLKTELKQDDPQVKLGAEVLICPGMEHMEELCDLCREGTQELLLELPFYRWSETVWETIYELKERGDIRVVIAHADRYPAENIEQLIKDGFPLQLNTDALMNPLRRLRYLRWIKEGYVIFLGSDIHMLGSGYQEWMKCRRILGENQ
jgi:protein-tyrosine phosphatase